MAQLRRERYVRDFVGDFIRLVRFSYHRRGRGEHCDCSAHGEVLLGRGTAFLRDRDEGKLFLIFLTGHAARLNDQRCALRDEQRPGRASRCAPIAQKSRPPPLRARLGRGASGVVEVFEYRRCGELPRLELQAFISCGRRKHAASVSVEPAPARYRRRSRVHLNPERIAMRLTGSGYYYSSLFDTHTY